MTAVSETDPEANAGSSAGHPEVDRREEWTARAVSESDLRVPDGETPARCPHCRRPFRTARLRDLHVGDVHPDEWTDDQRAAYESARESERDDLFLYHLKAIAALVATYAVFLLTYMAVSAMQTGA